MLFATPDSWFGFYFTIQCIVLYILTGKVLDFSGIFLSHAGVDLNFPYSLMGLWKAILNIWVFFQIKFLFGCFH